MNKTVKDWFKTLPAEIGDLAIKNVENHCPETLERKVDSLEVCFLGGFPWKDSPEGFDFWWRECQKTDWWAAELAKVAESIRKDQESFL